MEVDPPSSPGKGSADQGSAQDGASENLTTFKIHPLAIVEMSDHHTRVSSGGTPYPRHAPVIGLLFGTRDGPTVSIVDAQEMEVSHAAAYATDPRLSRLGTGTEEERRSHLATVETKIDLHRTVFPAQRVLGWYRASPSNEEEPTAEDLDLTRRFVAAHVDDGAPPSFLLFRTSDDDDGDGDDDGGDGVNNARLPLSVFEAVDRDGAAAFVQADFELDTFEIERIAVEQVFKSRATTTTTTTTTTKNPDEAAASSASSSKDNNDGDNNSSNSDSQLHHHLGGVSSSVRSLQARLRVLLEFCVQTRDGAIPVDHRLLREVRGLLRRAPIDPSRLPAQLDGDAENALLLTYLAVVAKATSAVETYAQKMRTSQERTSTSVGIGRERRF